MVAQTHQRNVDAVKSMLASGAARPGQTRDKTEPDRVFGNDEDDRDRRGCRLRSKDGGSIPTGLHHGDLPANQIGQ